MKANSLHSKKMVLPYLLLLLGAAWGGVGCSQDSPKLAEPSIQERILTPVEYEEFQSTPKDFSVSAGRFFLPPDFEARWPIDQDPRNISSTFGPRLKSSEVSRSDFHRGIDIPGELGQSVFPILPGKIYKAVAGGESSEGGNVVTLEHQLAQPMIFHGKSIVRFYSQYAHLDEFGAKVAQWLVDPGTEIEISPEEALGTVGQSGTTTFNHLHFEIRLETTCSLEFQVKHPQTQCAANGFDPHVNPLQFLLANDGEAPKLVSLGLEGGLLKVRVAADGLFADLDYLALRLFDGSKNLIKEFRIGFNAREGFDATSTESLDDPQLEGVLLKPAPFLSHSEVYEMTYAFELTGLSLSPVSARLLVEDVWGHGFSVGFDLD